MKYKSFTFVLFNSSCVFFMNYSVLLRISVGVHE